MPPLETPPVKKEFIAKDFRLLGIDDKFYSIKDIVHTNGFVVAFICNHCPYVKSIAKKIVEDVIQLTKIEVGFVAINSNDVTTYSEDSFENMKIFAHDHKFNFPYLFDDTQEIAKIYDAVCTPDFFGFDRDFKLQYRGRLDATGKSNNATNERELLNIMQLIAKNQNIDDIKQHASIGCSIKWKNNI